MFPKVLVASNNHPFKDFEGGSGTGYIVSQAFRDAVEIFDKGMHQFVPVDIRRKDGSQHDNLPFYILRVTRLLNAINFEASPDLLPATGGRDRVTDTTQLSTHRNSFAVHADKIAGMGLWLDERALGDIFVAQRLVDVLTERGTSGWLAQSSFVEI